MRAAIMTAPFQIGVQDIDIPVPKPHEVLVRMEAAGICGGDVHFYDGTHPYTKYPQIFGHELSGVVSEIGAEVGGGVHVGDRVIIEPAVACGKCYPCRIGKYNCCVNIDMIGAFRPGGFAEYLTVPVAYVHRMPEGMSFEAGALCEPFSIGAQVVHRAGVREDAIVTVLGAGPIGLAALVLLKRLYRVTVIAVDVVPERLERARQFGADVLINPREKDTLREVMELTGGEGSHVVIESAGLKLTMEQTIDLVSPGGRIVIVGLTNDNVSFPGILFTKKEVEIYGSRNNAGRFPEVIDFLTRYPDVAEAYVTRRIPFEDIAEALHAAKTMPNEVNKIILQYR